MDSYITVREAATAEFTEKRSRFISEIRPVSSEREYLAFLAEKKTAHRDAAHNCSAMLLRGETHMRYSDDGEPQGTAGMPILEVLRREGIVDAAIVVTRYFGGILLGAGGLTRAYANGAKLAVGAADRAEICRCADFSLAVPYPLYDRVALLLGECGAVTLDTGFGAEVMIRARIRASGLAPLEARLTELSAGKTAPAGVEEAFADMPAPPENC